MGKYRETHCTKCVTISRSSSYERFEQPIKCRYCDTLMGSVIKCKTKAGESTLDICTACREIGREKRRTCKLGPNNPNWNGGPKPKLSKEEFSKLNSERMKSDNPMFRPEVREKVSQTFKQNINIGKIKYVSGRTHHLWKGNRKHSFILRTRINGWVKNVLRRDEFKCQLCSKEEDLEVHHLISFKSVVDEVLITYNVKNLIEVDTNSDLFTEICREVKERHTLDMGITLCKKCHAEVDSKRRINESSS